MPKAAEANGGVHELKDILVEEVSLVDHPANKRRFLLVKRDPMSMELVPNGRGGFSRVAKKEEDDDEEEKRKKAAAAKKPFPGAAKPFGKPDDKEEKRIFEQDEEENEERKRKEKADASGKALAGELKAHISSLEKLVDSLDDHEDAEPSDAHVGKLVAAHKKLGGMVEKYMTKEARKELTKIGRKMATQRLDSFKAAIGTLQSLLAELMDSPAKTKEHDSEPGDPQEKPKGWSASNPSDVPTGKDGTAGGWRGGKNDDGVKLAKRVEELETENARLKRGVSASANSSTVEKSGRAVPSSEVAWPMDMNRPITRETVNKNESFFDD